MMTKRPISNAAYILVLISILSIPSGCKKDNNNPDNSKVPLWVYNTNEDPYQSKPCVAGDKVIVCTLPRDGDEITQPGTHCIDRNTGSLIWKVNDTITGMIISPLIYNDLIIKGGLNPHARKLSDGSLEWIYVNDTIKYSMYSNPLIVGDAAYFACMFQVIKLDAADGGTVWSTPGWYTNLRSSRLVYKNDRLYYGDSFENK